MNKYQGQAKNIININMNKHMTNHRKKLMEIGGRETNLLERMATSSIHPYMNRAIIYG
jgi:hypothetical protein